MKRAIATAALLFLCNLSAGARVGETKTEVDTRYGEGRKQSGNRIKAGGAESWIYKKAGFVIEVEFVDGKSVFEVIQREGKIISDEEIKALLKIYDTPATNWRFDKKESQWKRGGKPKLVAYRWPGHPDFFCIKDVEVCDALERKEKANADQL